MEGWIKLHRKMLQWEWYDDINTKCLFIHCLLKANIEDKKWRGITIKRGQLYTSVAKLSKELKLSSKQIRTAINKLEKTGEIIRQKSANKGAKHGTMITVCKYEDYQPQIKTEGQTKGQIKGKRRANEGQLLKNNKNNKKEKKEERKEKNIIPPQKNMVEKYCRERGNDINVDKWYNFYESKGWMIGKNKMKDWQAAVRTWENKDETSQYKKMIQKARETAEKYKNKNGYTG